MTQNIWVVIPLFNEEKHIGTVIDKTLEITHNILVIDDGSVDNSLEIAKVKNVKLIRHKNNMGKGATIRSGCDYAFKHLEASHVVLIDSDGQHRPADIPHFIDLLDKFDIIFGSRHKDKSMSIVFRFGNWFISTVTWLCSGIKLHDTQSGFRALSKEAYDKVRWKANRYSVESEMILRAGKKNLSYKEIFIHSPYHDANKGTTVMDGVKIVIDTIKLRLGGIK